MQNASKRKAPKDLFSLKEINSVWRTVLHLAKKKVIPKNGSIEIRSSNNNMLMFLDKGLISLRSINAQGRQRISLYYESGCFIGEPAVLANTKDPNRLQYYHAHEETTVYLFPPTCVTDANFIKEHPELIQNLLQSLTIKLRYFQALVADKSGECATEVICRYINRLAEKNHSNTFSPRMSQSEFAMSVGLHRSTVCRIIKELREDGIIGEFSKTKLEILDRMRLKSLAFGVPT